MGDTHLNQRVGNVNSTDLEKFVGEFFLADGAYTRERLITRNSAHLPSEVGS